MIVAINAKTLGVTTYDISAVDVVRLSDDIGCVTSDGVMTPGGNEPVSGVIETGVLSLGIDGPMRVPRMFACLEGDADTVISMRLDSAFKGDEDPVHRVQQWSAQTPVWRDVSLGRGPRMDAVSFQIEAIGSGAWGLRGVKFDVVPAQPTR